MNYKKDVNWFKSTLEPILQVYQIEYKHFKEGDFGSLDQVRFESSKRGGSIDFWGLGWVGIFVWDYVAESEIMNILLEPHQECEFDEAFEKLRKNLCGN